MQHSIEKLDIALSCYNYKCYQGGGALLPWNRGISNVDMFLVKPTQLGLSLGGSPLRDLIFYPRSDSAGCHMRYSNIHVLNDGQHHFIGTVDIALSKVISVFLPCSIVIDVMFCVGRDFTSRLSKSRVMEEVILADVCTLAISMTRTITIWV